MADHPAPRAAAKSPRAASSAGWATHRRRRSARAAALTFCLVGLFGWLGAGAAAAPLAETGAVVVGGEPKDLLVDEARGRLFVSDFAGDSVAVVDLTTGLVTRRLPTPDGPVGLALTADGRSLYVAAYLGGAVCRIDVQSGRLEAVLGGLGDPWDLALVTSQGRSLLALTEHHSDQVTFVDAQTLAHVESLPTDYYPYELTPDEVTRRLYVASYGGRDGGEVAAVDLDSLSQVWARSAGQGSFDVVVDSARDLVVVSDFTGQTLSRFDLDGRIAGTQPLSGGPKALLLSQDGLTLYAALQNLDRVQALDPAAGVDRSWAATGSRPGALAWWADAPGGSVLLAADQGDGTVSVLSQGQAPPPFADVPSSHPSYRAVRVLAVRGVLSGYESDGGPVTFKPENTLMRAHLAKIMVGAMGLHTEAVELDGEAFADVPATKDAAGALVPYPYDYINEASRAGIVTGFTGQPPRFKPYQAVTRIQLLRMSVRAAEAVGSPLPAPRGSSPFYDVTPAHPDYRVAVQAFEAGLIGPVLGPDGRARLHPYDPATRAVTADVVFHLLGALHRETGP